jgi:hypothetical protein
LSEVATLSLIARLGVALHLFAGYCRCRGIDHPEVGRFVEHMWAFAALPGGGEGFEDWLLDRPDLAESGLGYEWPSGFAEYLRSHGVAEEEFRSALMHCTEVLYGSLYTAADDAGSLRDVAALGAIALRAGAAWPDLSPFAASLWVGGGWGGRLSTEELAPWRAAGQRHAESGTAVDGGGMWAFRGS